MQAYIVLQSISGLGDQYTSVLSGYQTFLDLKEMGYDVLINWETKTNQYFNKDIPLDCIFDLSVFDKVIYNEEESISKNILLNQNQRSYRIYVSELVPALENYQSKLYGFERYRTNLDSEESYPTFKKQFLSREVLDIASGSIATFLTHSLTGIHFRCDDAFHLSDIGQIKKRYVEELNNLNKIIVSNPDILFMVCSNNKKVVDMLSANHINTFKNYFTNRDIPLYYCYEQQPLDTEDSMYIRHAQEIAAEMSLFAYCSKIIAYNTFPSSFLTYGITHNIHYSSGRLKNLGLL